MISTERNHGGALIVRAFVRDGAQVWMLARTFYGYSKRDALRIYRAEVRASGWVLA